jgi:iduronate 2-sulfatase
LTHLKDPTTAASKPAHSFWTGGQRSIRTERWRLTVLPTKDKSSAQFELFDYQTDPDETQNHAVTQPEVVSQLLAMLKDIPDPTQR